MFTGIVEAVGQIDGIAALREGMSLRIAAGNLDLSDVEAGDSISINGVCLTVTSKGENATFTVDVSRETLNCTAGLTAQGERVNLEKALRLSDRLGGHMVSGHVDGIGEVTGFERTGESRILTIRVPRSLSKYIARKGSITVNGVSLTVNRVEEDEFEVNLIPHTLAATNLLDVHEGANVNLEVDMLARYLERLLAIPMIQGST